MLRNISTQVVVDLNNNKSSCNIIKTQEKGGVDQEIEHEDQEPLSNNKHNVNLMVTRSNCSLCDIVEVKYMECLKNHAASIGGNARDGCGEFMPTTGEEEGALKCSVCQCHRNFHRKLFQEVIGYPTGTMIITPKASLEQRRISYKNGVISDSDDGKEEEANFMSLKRPNCQQQANMKKRFRTKFTAEQKEKMYEFAEKAGWKIQKLDDSFVHQFCQEVGIKRRVLKVWMHNNKHNSANKNSHTT